MADLVLVVEDRKAGTGVARAGGGEGEGGSVTWQGVEEAGEEEEEVGRTAGEEDQQVSYCVQSIRCLHFMYLKFYEF